MAIIRIKNATVERSFSGGKGYALLEKFTKRDGTEGFTPYTAWFDEPQDIPTGATGDFSGLYSDKIEDYDKSDGSQGRAIRRNLNSAKVDGQLTITSGNLVADEPF